MIQPQTFLPLFSEQPGGDPLTTFPATTPTVSPELPVQQVSQPQSIYDIYRDQLRKAQLSRQALDVQRQGLLDQQMGLLEQRPSMRFVEDEQAGFLDALKNPSESQRALMINAGLALASSKSTNSLSNRVAQALGAGVQGMAAQRQRDQQSELEKARLRMMKYSAERDALSDRAAEAKQGFDVGRAEAASEAATQERIRKAQIDQRNFALKLQESQRKRFEAGLLTAAQFQKNQDIINSRDAAASYVLNNIDNPAVAETLKLMNRFKVKNPNVDLSTLQGADMMVAEIFGAGSKKNPDYNPELLKAIQLAANPLFSKGARSRDSQSRFFRNLLTDPEKQMKKLKDLRASYIKEGLDRGVSEEDSVRLFNAGWINMTDNL